MKIDVYTQEGKKDSTVEVSEAVFASEWNADLVHQVVVSMQANARSNVAHTKDRSDVKGGGRKPWQQKGLGRARHGSIRSPIWTGGGVAFGPRNERNFSKKINKKMRAKALFSVLSKKFDDSEIIFVDAIKFDKPKTAQAKSTLEALAKIKGYEALITKKHNTVLISLPNKDANVLKSFSNFGNVTVSNVLDMNPVDTLRHKYVIIVNPSEASKQLSARIKK